MVIKILKSKFITQGSQNEIFKKLIIKNFKNKYYTLVNSASSTIYVACRALGLKKMIFYGQVQTLCSICKLWFIVQRKNDL